jgi:hypothetical protein
MREKKYIHFGGKSSTKAAICDAKNEVKENGCTFGDRSRFPVM